ncbi:hypothetical protein CK203_110324 [Vitis vinifera]|uniref:Transposon Ty3-I Gag-Pol polyprotein n=1 Tax=Vitis vinifera TaxID=29760 RepID=A0A438CVU9_VITVI|nr:hypothetical protein CK203_110324 [Vitis vinifera]
MDPCPSTSVLIAPSSPDRTSLMTLCFPDEIDEHGTLAEGASDFVDPPLSFDVLSRFFDIDDEIAQHDSDDDSSSVSDSDPVDQRVSPAVGDTEIVDFGTADQPRELRIGSDLSTDERDSLIQLLRAYLDVFAWSMRTCRALIHLSSSIVKEEIQKQLSVGFLSVVEYPEWLANVVPVPKKDGKVRVCVDFRDLNKASPKDDFPLHTSTC